MSYGSRGYGSPAPVNALKNTVVSFREGSATSAGAYATSLTLTIPATVQTGDLMLISRAGQSAVGSGLSGWTLFSGGAFSTGVATLFSKVATSSDAGSTLTITNSGGNERTGLAFAAYYSPVSGATLSLGTVPTATTVSGGTTHTTPTITTTQANQRVISMWQGRENNDFYATTVTAGTGYQLRSTQTTAQQVFNAIGDELVATPGTTTGRTLTTTTQFGNQNSYNEQVAIVETVPSFPATVVGPVATVSYKAPLGRKAVFSQHAAAVYSATSITITTAIGDLILVSVGKYSATGASTLSASGVTWTTLGTDSFPAGSASIGTTTLFSGYATTAGSLTITPGNTDYAVILAQTFANGAQVKSWSRTAQNALTLTPPAVDVQAGQYLVEFATYYSGSSGPSTYTDSPSGTSGTSAPVIGHWSTIDDLWNGASNSKGTSSVFTDDVDRTAVQRQLTNAFPAGGSGAVTYTLLVGDAIPNATVVGPVSTISGAAPLGAVVIPAQVNGLASTEAVAAPVGLVAISTTASGAVASVTFTAPPGISPHARVPGAVSSVTYTAPDANVLATMDTTQVGATPGITYTTVTGDVLVGPVMVGPSAVAVFTSYDGGVEGLVGGIVLGEVANLYVSAPYGEVDIDYSPVQNFKNNGVCKEGHNYQAFIVDMKTRIPVQELDWASLTYTVVLNDHQTASLEVDASQVSRALIKPGRSMLAVFRDGVNVWQGPVMGLEKSSGASSLTISAVGITQFLERRLLKENIPYQSESLQNTIGQYLALAQQGVGGNLGLGLRYTGYLEPVFTDFIAANDDHTIAELIKTLSNQKLGFDWLAGQENDFTAYLDVSAPRKYVKKKSVVFEYNDNMTDYQWSQDFHSVSNYIKVHGGGEPSAQDVELSRSSVYLQVTEEDVLSQLESFRLESTVQYGTVTDIDQLSSIGSRLIAKRARAYDKLGGITVMGCTDSPHFGTYGPGDVTRCVIDDGFVQVDGLYRITSMTVTPEVGANEKVELIFEDAQAAIL